MEAPAAPALERGCGLEFLRLELLSPGARLCAPPGVSGRAGSLGKGHRSGLASRPGWTRRSTLTEVATLPSLGASTFSPAFSTASQETGLFAVRPLGARESFRRPLSEAHLAEVSRLWRKLMFSRSSRV